MNTLENNKLIAEFMGFKECPIYNNKGKKYDYYIPKGFELIKEIETTIEGVNCEVLEIQDYCMVEDLKFHISWDWLIPVINKIFSLDEYINYKNYSSNTISDGGIFINTAFIENTHTDVVDFIKWYNKNIKS